MSPQTKSYFKFLHEEKENHFVICSFFFVPSTTEDDVNKLNVEILLKNIEKYIFEKKFFFSEIKTLK